MKVRIVVVLLVAILVMGLGSYLMAQTPPYRQAIYYAAQIAVGKEADGSEWRTIVKFINRSEKRSGGSYELRDQTNNPLVVRGEWANGVVAEFCCGTFEFSSKSAMAKTLTAVSNSPAAGTNSSSIQVGWLKFWVRETWSDLYQTYMPDVVSQVIFQRMKNGVVDSSVGVPVVRAGTDFLLDLEVTSRSDTGVAIANPNSTPAVVTLKAYNDGGSPEWMRDGVMQPFSEVSMTLAPGQQISRFVSEIFVDNTQWKEYTTKYGPDRKQNSLEIVSDLPVAVTAVRADFSPGSFQMSGVPIFPGREKGK